MLSIAIMTTKGKKASTKQKRKPLTLEQVNKLKFDADILRKKYDIRYRDPKKMPLYMLAQRHAIDKIDIKLLKKRNKFMLMSDKEIEQEDLDDKEETDVLSDDDDIEEDQDDEGESDPTEET